MFMNIKDSFKVTHNKDQVLFLVCYECPSFRVFIFTQFSPELLPSTGKNLGGNDRVSCHFLEETFTLSWSSLAFLLLWALCASINDSVELLNMVLILARFSLQGLQRLEVCV